jgi:hypothetical protein
VLKPLAIWREVEDGCDYRSYRVDPGYSWTILVPIARDGVP